MVFSFKLNLAMRLTLVLLVISILSVQANGYSQKTKVTLNLEKVELRMVLEKIESLTDFKFLYDTDKIDEEKLVSVKMVDKPVDQVLDYLFSGTSVYYVLSKKQIVLKVKTILPKTSTLDDGKNSIIEDKVVQNVVSGTIADQAGQPLPGASVVEKGTTNGTQSDFDGNFSIELQNENAILVVSYVGFGTKEIPTNGQISLNIILEESASGLDEVVVVGYGTQKKVNLTGSISTIEFDEEMANRPITNASQALGGTASGIWVSQNSGKPGSDGAQIRVRGWGTLNNSNPLIIIDGIEGSFDQINPNDIENISVLKDAASSAIYGSKAANGVVLITTKLGKKNEDMQVNINSYIGLQSLGRRYDLITDSAEQMGLSNQALINDGVSPLYPDYLIDEFRNGTDPYKYPNTDWFDELYRTAVIQEHNVSIRGGSEKTASFISLNYLDQDGIIPNTNSERYGVRANVESNVNDWLKLSARVNYIRKDSKEPYADITYGSMGRVFDMLQGAAPYIAPYTRDGRYGSVQAITNGGDLLYDNRNPLIDAANGETKSGADVLTLNVSADIKFSENLSLKTTIATNRDWNMTDRYNTSVFGYTDTGIETITKNYNREGLEINRSQISSIQNNLFTTLNYNKNFAEAHDVSAIVGMQIESNQIQNVYSRRSEPPKEGLTQVDAGTSGIQGEGNMIGFKMLSYFGRVNYSILDKYLFEANIRADASSRFRSDNRWGVFPGFSAGWRLSQEKFIQDLQVFSNLKLRTSWGQLGNQNLSSYWPYLTVIGQNNDLSYSYNGNFVPGAAITALVDEDITWETSSTFDAGIEVGLLDGKINLEANYFQKKTTDILVQLPIPLILGGISSPFENVGEMTNNGLEFVVNYSNRKIEKNQLGFNAGLNVTYIENEVTKFRGGKSPDQLYLIREGYSYNSLYGHKAIGIYQTDNEAMDHMHSNSFKPQAGDLKFEDVNKDGKLNFEDKMGLGNTIPKLTFGLSAGFKYQGFDLQFLFQGIAGLHMYTQNQFTNVTYENRTFSKKWMDAWTPENSDTHVPSIKFSNTWDNQQSSYWVNKMDFVKLKNIQLGFDFPNDIVNTIGLDKLYIYANAQNVFTLVNSDYEGYDPERGTFGSGNNVYPTPRIISFGINLNF